MKSTQNTHHSDHRALGRDLGIFATDPLAGSGLALWLPAGSVIRDELERLARDIARGDGCVEVHTPVLGKRALFERSGHWAKFADDMFPPMQLGDEAPEEQLVLRPANCPHHAMVYAARPHSYRELPIRLHELAPMFRAERSGVVSGLTRVRQINLDDTHVFCRPDQVADEAARALRSALHAQEVLGLPVDYVRLSLRDEGPGYLGDAQLWAEATAALRNAAASSDLAARSLPLVEASGEAAFYGPKLDLQVRSGDGSDGSAREETIATVQLDFVQPERFDLRYDGADGDSHLVVMIHRGTVGAMERVTAALLEQYDGRMPLWLNHVQLQVLPVSESADAVAREFVDALLAHGLRAVLDADGSLGARIRRSRERRNYAYAVLGEAEIARGTVQLTDASSGWRGSLSHAEAVAILAQAYADRAAPRWPVAVSPDDETPAAHRE
ncbi:aminoacyl--tRNA ligase-related protein [Flexivirga caeni]|uniref:threonine--tRNA ligase n=1 Tax=Flexivirga caeni TaxID=2294115 RepID=A0A3M9M2P6_9MICO|nr:aminoacyl--tRNA ligase-related protein [Flexivirga caeni]RNI19861.1 threonine--tRNA ligase [Flexivirga caeni]